MICVVDAGPRPPARTALDRPASSGHVLTPLPFHWGLVQFLLVKISVVRVRGLSAVCPQRTGGASVTIIELPQAQRYRRTFAELQTRCPALVPVERWQQAVADAKRFLAKWGEQAESLGWSSADLFGLHTEPAKPHPSYNRLLRYDCTGLCWLLQGRRVTVLTADTAAIENPTGNIIVFRKNNRPALGPTGDCLDERN
jgi:hypothetical protein